MRFAIRQHNLGARPHVQIFVMTCMLRGLPCRAFSDVCHAMQVANVWQVSVSGRSPADLQDRAQAGLQQVSEEVSRPTWQVSLRNTKACLRLVSEHVSRRSPLRGSSRSPTDLRQRSGRSPTGLRQGSRGVFLFSRLRSNCIRSRISTWMHMHMDG